MVHGSDLLRPVTATIRARGGQGLCKRLLRVAVRLAADVQGLRAQAGA